MLLTEGRRCVTSLALLAACLETAAGGSGELSSEVSRLASSFITVPGSEYPSAWGLGWDSMIYVRLPVHWQAFCCAMQVPRMCSVPGDSYLVAQQRQRWCVVWANTARGTGPGSSNLLRPKRQHHVKFSTFNEQHDAHSLKFKL